MAGQEEHGEGSNEFGLIDFLAGLIIWKEIADLSWAYDG
jgi:hypothetical protein